MQKVLIATMIGLLATCISSTASAIPYTMDLSDLDKLYELAEGPYSDNDNTDYDAAIPSLRADGAFAPEIGWFYYDPTATPTTGNPNSDPDKFAWIRIGVNSTGTASFGLPGGYSGSAADLTDIGANDLSGYDQYSLLFTNVNQSIWATRLYLETTANTYYSSWAWLPNYGSTAGLAIDLSTVSGSVTAIGFDIGSKMIGDVNPDYPSDNDTAHIKVEPVPEPTSMLLLGFGLIGLVGKRVRRKFKA